MESSFTFDNKKDFALYVSSVQAQYDQVDALHSETLQKWEAHRSELLADGDNEHAEKVSELIAGAIELKKEVTEKLNALYWALDNLFNDEGEVK